MNQRLRALTRATLIVAILCVAGGCSQIQTWREQRAITDHWVGAACPDFEYTTLDGVTRRISEHRGRRVLLSFWATWCVVCRYEIPEILSVVRRRPGEIDVLGIASDDPETLRAFLKEQPIDYPIASIPDHRLPAPFNALPAIPVSVALDEQGKIVDMHFGFIGDSALEAFAWPAENP